MMDGSKKRRIHVTMGESELPSSASVSAGSRAPSKSPPMAPPKKRNALLRPAIYEFSCNGYIHLEDRARSNADGGPSSTTHRDPTTALPHCRGIQSKLRKVRELPPSTRDASIMEFLQMLSLEPPNENCPPIGPASALPVLPGAADYGPPPDDLPIDPARADINKRESGRLGAVQILPNPDVEAARGENNANSDSDYYSTLSCWGMTNVSVLMLTKPDGKRDVAAIAPENTLGVTVRDEGDARGGDATGTVRIGPIEVAITNRYECETASTTNKNEEGNMAPKGDTSNLNSNADEDIEASEPFADRLGATLTKTAENMRDNAKTVADVEFPRRMLKSSERIANEFGSTLQRTGKVAKSIFRLWSDDDDNNDNNDGGY